MREFIDQIREGIIDPAELTPESAEDRRVLAADAMRELGRVERTLMDPSQPRATADLKAAVNLRAVVNYYLQSPPQAGE